MKNAVDYSRVHKSTYGWKSYWPLSAEKILISPFNRKQTELFNDIHMIVCQRCVCTRDLCEVRHKRQKQNIKSTKTMSDVLQRKTKNKFCTLAIWNALHTKSPRNRGIFPICESSVFGHAANEQCVCILNMLGVCVWQTCLAPYKTYIISVLTNAISEYLLNVVGNAIGNFLFFFSPIDIVINLTKTASHSHA